MENNAGSFHGSLDPSSVPDNSSMTDDDAAEDGSDRVGDDNNCYLNETFRMYSEFNKWAHEALDYDPASNSERSLNNQREVLLFNNCFSEKRLGSNLISR